MTKPFSSYSYKTWLPILLALTTALGMLVGYRMSSENMSASSMINGLTSKSDEEKTLQEILKYIDNRYVDSVDTKVLVESATNAILDHLDPHSVYISPEQLGEVNESMSGFYKGMGIETVFLDDTLRVIGLLGGSPAEEAGIVYGDMILAVNDSLLAGQGRDRNEQWDMLRSRNGQNFQLQLLNDEEKERKVDLVPRKLKAPNVDYFSFDGNSYINILRFSDKTYEGIVDALEALQENKAIDRLILDLRNNPGGYLPEATKILNQLFVEDKRLLVYTEDRTKRKTEYNTTGRPFYEIKKLAILVNDGSASASEIIAGALQDWDKAIIIGTDTYGKGLVQEQFNLSNGGAVRLTTARYFTPSGRSIQRPYSDVEQDTVSKFYSKTHLRELSSYGGITPDYLVSWTDLDIYTQEKINQNQSLYSYNILRKVLKDTDINQPEAIDNGVNESLDVIFENESYNDELAFDMLKYSVLKQLNKKEDAQLLRARYDIFIRTATEKLKQENVFAELIEN